MIRISYLLPCYKVEKYLRACIDSIYNANLPLNEFEVLCFDDCSPDGTPQLLDKLAQEHSNLQVIHSIENVGSGGGRNTLMERANGKYVWFLDPDDTIISNNVISLLEQAENNQLDVLLFNYTDVNKDGISLGTGSYFPDTIISDGVSFVDTVFGKTIVSHMGYPWRFIVRREYLISNHLKFPEKIVFQDTVWMPKLMLYAERIQSSATIGYDYWHRETSVCGRFDTKYPAKSIYTWCITVPGLLMDFASELKAKGETDSRYLNYVDVFNDFAVSHYINVLPIYLSRTNSQERKQFYAIIRENKGVPDRIENRANVVTRLLLFSRIGSIMSPIVAFIYRITHHN